MNSTPFVGCRENSLEGLAARTLKQLNTLDFKRGDLRGQTPSENRRYDL